MHILIYSECAEGSRLLDTAYCDQNPTGGSETACAYVIQELKARGHQVEFVKKRGDFAQKECDVFISLRELAWFHGPDKTLPGKLKYLWSQDDATEPFLDLLRKPQVARDVYSRLDGILLLSHYQWGRWREMLHAPDEKVFLTNNGIPLEKFRQPSLPLSERGKRCYYASSPDRGLKILLERWPEIHRHVPGSELFVLSSHPRYPGAPQTPVFQELYHQAEALPGVHYLSGVGQARLREVAEKSRVLAYPCAFAETSCICAMEAMASGCVVAATSLGALPETAWRNPLVPYDSEFNWVVDWTLEVIKLLLDDTYHQFLARQNLEIARHMSWARVVEGWEIRFQQDAAMRGFELV